MTLRSHAWLADVVRAAPCRWPLRLVAIDGKAGAGKSTFASKLSERLGFAPVLPIDDFLAWEDLTDFWPRLERDVLAPLFEGRDIEYQARDWHNDTFGRGLGPWKQLPFAPIVIFEGIGSSRREIADRLALRVWIEAPEALRLDRGVRRDGEALRDRWIKAQRLEQLFFDRDQTVQRADLVVSGENRVGMQSHEFWVLRAHAGFG